MFEEIREARVRLLEHGSRSTWARCSTVWPWTTSACLAERLVPSFLSRFSNALPDAADQEREHRQDSCAAQPNPQTVVSWSLNTQRMIETYEIGTASLEERIECRETMPEHGYRIRLRIDPGILYDRWQIGLRRVASQALTVLEPENVTLGMLRLLPGHLALARQAYGGRAIV